MTDEPIVEPGEPTVEPVQKPQEQVPETADELKGRLETMERERDDALNQNKEAQGLVGRHTEELNKLRNENAYYQQQVQQPHPQNPEVGSLAGSAKYDPYDQESVDRYFATKQKEALDAQNANLRAYESYKHQKDIGSAFNRGQRAIQQNPEFFKGIEKKTVDMMGNLVQSGQNVQPETLENPESWFYVGDVIKGQESRSGKAPVIPMVAPTVDTPSAVRTEGPTKTEDMGISETIVQTLYGGDRKAATEGMRDGATEREEERK